MQFFYFSERELSKPPEALAYAFDADNPHVTTAIGANGPHGGSGTLLRAQAIQFDVKNIDASQQEWRKLPGNEGLWLGWLKNDHPRPEELERNDRLNGHLVTLSDGNEWMIPVVQRLSGSNGAVQVEMALPRTYGMNEQGDWTWGPVMRPYQRLWEIAMCVTEGMDSSGESDVTLTVPDENNLCSEILGVNYRVSAHELGFTNLLNENAVPKIFSAMLDLPKLSKKNSLSDISSTQTGGTDATPTTAQRTPTSS